jgi:hypothetical protein
VECKSKTDTSNNRTNWNHLKIIQKIPEMRTEKARTQGLRQKAAILGTASMGLLRKAEGKVHRRTGREDPDRK